MTDKQKEINNNKVDESLEDQIAIFLKSGGKVKEIGQGVTTPDANNNIKSIFIGPAVDISRVKK
jgi:hypothetical protein